MHFSTFILRNLSRRPLRAILTIIAIAMAIGSVVTFVGIASSFERSFLTRYQESDIDIVVSPKGSKLPGQSALPQSLGLEIERIQGVKQAIPELIDINAMPPLDKVIWQGLVPETIAMKPFKIQDGRALKHDDTRSIIIGAVLSKNLNKKTGDEVELIQNEPPFKIVGVFQSNNVFENGALVIPINELQKLIRKENRVSSFNVVLERSKDEVLVNEVKPKIEALSNKPKELKSKTEALGKKAKEPERWPAIIVMPARDHVKSRVEVGLFKGMAWLTSAIALIIGLFGMMNTMIMSVSERTREIGILRAVGWKVGRVIRMVLLEAVFLSVIGATVGVIGAILLVRALTQLPAVNNMIDGRIDPFWYAVGFAIAIGVGLVGGLLPASRAARMLPTEALRYE